MSSFHVRLDQLLERGLGEEGRAQQVEWYERPTEEWELVRIYCQFMSIDFGHLDPSYSYNIYFGYEPVGQWDGVRFIPTIISPPSAMPESAHEHLYAQIHKVQNNRRRKR